MLYFQLIGVWVLADVLVQNGKGSKCRIVELGPGKGTLANDIIKVSQVVVASLLYISEGWGRFTLTDYNY